MLSEGDVGVVLCSYHKQTANELSVSSGDLVLVNSISSDIQWAWCRSSSNKEGFVPVSYIKGGTATSQQQSAFSTQQWVQHSPSPVLSDSELSQDYFCVDTDPNPAPAPLSVYEDDSVPKRCYKVLCRFGGSSPQDLPVSAGDLVLGTDEPGQSRRWVHSCRLGGGSGYVPKNSLILASETESKPWFLGQISRRDAEDILTQSSVRLDTFLVRESLNTNGFVISYKKFDATKLEVCIKHRMINHANGQYTAWNGFDFPTLLDLVETHLTTVGNNHLHHPYDKGAGTQICVPQPRPSQMASTFASRPLPPLPKPSLPSPPIRRLQPRPCQPPPPPPMVKPKPRLLPLTRPPLPDPPGLAPSKPEQADQDDVNSVRRSSQGSSNHEPLQGPERPLYAATRVDRWSSMRKDPETIHKRDSRVQESSNESELFIGSQCGGESEENSGMYLESSQASATDEQEWCLPPITTHEHPPAPPASVPDGAPRPAGVAGTMTRGLSNPREYDVDVSQVEKLESLGSGFYGEVWKVKFLRLGTHLAMKTLNPNTMNVADFVREAEAMKDLRHPNLVKLYGVCSDDSFMLIEYYPNGSVQDYLKRGGILSDRQKLEIMKNVAAGMKYLSEMDYIHRDLAARNVLLADDLTARVADFGLAQLMKDDGCKRTTNLKMPWKWTAPEALCGGNQWSPLSDVWSYGVFCWELYSNCLTTLYSGICNSRELLNFLTAGGKLGRPDGCIDSLYSKLMLRCWALSTSDRITFEYIVGFLKYNELLEE